MTYYTASFYLGLDVIIAGVSAGWVDDVHVLVTYKYIPEEKPSFDPIRGIGDPGCDASVEILTVSVEGRNPSVYMSHLEWRELAEDSPWYNQIMNILETEYLQRLISDAEWEQP